MLAARKVRRSVDSWDVKSGRFPGGARPKLTDGSRIGVIGGGPAGALFSYYLLGMAEMAGLDIAVDIWDPRDFLEPTPSACNMCGGIISETLVQNLATDGINLPASVVQRGIESYQLHIDGRQVGIDAPVQEKRIASVYRGTGPRKLDVELKTWRSFDGYLQQLAIGRGARPVRKRVTEVVWEGGRPRIGSGKGTSARYDLVAVATGVNSPTLKLFKDAPLHYDPPATTKTFIREYHLGEEVLEQRLGNAMHVFLLDIPGLEFAAIIPKLNCATVCLLGDNLDKEVFRRFLESTEVRECLSGTVSLDDFACTCSPSMNVRAASRPFGDRVVFIGDSGVTRLYKDGIGAAYRTAKAAARTVVFSGVSESDFERHFLPTCRGIARDNVIGHLVFGISRLITTFEIGRRAIIRMVDREQNHKAVLRMSTVMWDMFTGSATYREIFLRTLHPVFLARFSAAVAASMVRGMVPGAGTSAFAEAQSPGGDIGEG
jgi:flavin-dependent dehydrogenase